MSALENGTPESEEATLEKMRTEHREAQEKLESNAEATLTKLRGGEPTPEPEPEPNPEPDPEPKPEPDPQPKPKPEPKAEPEPDPEPEPEPAGKEPEPADEHALSQAEVRAAIHNGLSQEDIDELAEANPRLAKKTCAKALESQNNLSQKFSELGKTQAAKPVEPAVPVTPAPDPQPKSAIDFTALDREYENDPIVGVLKQVVEQSQAQAVEIGTLREAGIRGDAKVDAAQAQQDAAVSQQIDTFFDRPDVSVYGDRYGIVEKESKNWDDLTQGQIKKRYEVAEEAHMIMMGHKATFPNVEEMPMSEAFERAHDRLTKDVREQTIRKNIKAKAVKRDKSLTLAPTDSVKVPDSGKKTLAKAEKNAEGLLARLRRR